MIKYTDRNIILSYRLWGEKEKLAFDWNKLKNKFQAGNKN